MTGRSSGMASRLFAMLGAAAGAGKLLLACCTMGGGGGDRASLVGEGEDAELVGVVLRRPSEEGCRRRLSSRLGANFLKPR
ncbi:hypothetical protein HYQ46_009595 [Verticillium longisporum]|nr:hypothetical protein HYQ46_009595 [Verticillium longisporum]